MSRMQEYYFVSEGMLLELAREVLEKCRTYNYYVQKEQATRAKDEYAEITGMMKALDALDIEMLLEFKDNSAEIYYFEFDTLDYGWYVEER